MLNCSVPPILSSHLADCPAPLVSSDRSVSVPVEASIEDLDVSPCNPAVESTESSVQTDARAVSGPSVLEEKLHQELQYHKHGSYTCVDQPDSANYHHQCYPHPLTLQRFTSLDHTDRQPMQDNPSLVSSVQSWTKAEPVQPTSQEDPYRPYAGLYESMATTASVPTACHLPMSASSPSLAQLPQQHPFSQYDRQQSWPVYPVSDTAAPNKIGSLQDPGTCNILLFKNFLHRFQNQMPKICKSASTTF